MNSNTFLPKSFPIPIEGRDDFFSVDPKSFNIKQLNKYKKELSRLINIEKLNLKKIAKNFNARINAYKHGILLAEETIKTNPIMNSKFNYQSLSSYPKESIDPKILTITQLQLYIKGINEEITYEKKFLDEFINESTSRIEAYQNGIKQTDYELNIRKEK